MSLSLIQGYSSTEEDEYQNANLNLNLKEASDDSDAESDEYDDANANANAASAVGDDPAVRSCSSTLPSAVDAFSQIAGPPQFLNNSVEEYGDGGGVVPVQQQRRRRRSNKNDLPPGAVVEANAQLVGIRERVRSDVDAKSYPISSALSETQEGGKRVAIATNPNAEDAAELLRMCLQCGVPKTYSSARGMVCPVCGDRPPIDKDAEAKKKGSTIKDKEKSKRMKGQSSHATWKSETEMQLRQQFD